MIKKNVIYPLTTLSVLGFFIILGEATLASTISGEFRAGLGDGIGTFTLDKAPFTGGNFTYTESRVGPNGEQASGTYQIISASFDPTTWHLLSFRFEGISSSNDQITGFLTNGETGSAPPGFFDDSVFFDFPDGRINRSVGGLVTTQKNTHTPEPTSILGLFSLGILGVGATIKRQVKRNHSIEKETTKIG